MYLQLRTSPVSIEDVYGWLYEIHFDGSGGQLETVLSSISFSTFKSNSFFWEYNDANDVFSIDLGRVIDHFFFEKCCREQLFCKSDNSGIWDSAGCHPENSPA